MCDINKTGYHSKVILVATVNNDEHVAVLNINVIYLSDQMVVQKQKKKNICKSPETWWYVEYYSWSGQVCGLVQ